MAKLRDTLFIRQKCTNPKSKRFGAQEACTELYGTVDVWITVGLQTFLL